MLGRLAPTTLAAMLIVGTAASAGAADLVFGRATEQSSLDPHFSQTGNNNATADAMFENLVAFDAHLQLHPSLAVSWKLLDPTDWEIKLRPNVRFQDGTPLTGADIAYSLERVRHIPRSPAPWTHAVTAVAGVDVVDPLTLHIRTNGPTPLLMQQIGLIYILPAKLGPDVGNDDFNSGRAAIGTGPYRFKSYTPNDRLEFDANRDWWGGKPAFDHVTLRFIPNAAARSAALLSGQVDLIDSVSPSDGAQLVHARDITVYSSATNRIIYLALDATRDPTPFVTGADGKPLTPNPLKDLRVRQALSAMINREALATRIMSGAAVPAGQIVPEGEGGYAPDLTPTPFDPQRAKTLLSEVGLASGFGLTIQTSSDRYPNDSQVAQAVGQMFARGGLRVAVDAQPYSVFAPAATARKYSVFLFGWSSGSGDSSEALRSVLATYDPENGLGALNRVRYSNPAFDKTLAQAVAEFDETKRNGLLADATRIAMHDVALIPLYWQKAIWAARPGVRFEANESEDSSVTYAHANH
ncbi:MAG TPA: ABC transporter substrate-binding protein [Acetobacteraceae bacterium]|jgi:peptide/nickel transport system substrate-binding protein|nr:ABC transporter substrate-binding protein [Acetobacteraceae bacterium]